VAVTYNTALFNKQTEWIRRLLKERNGHVVVVAARNPFDFIDFPEASTQIASYETRPLAMQSTAKVLTGQIEPTGKLPVDYQEFNGS
jgi:beta-N-acetylhexosaminidase